VLAGGRRSRWHRPWSRAPPSLKPALILLDAPGGWQGPVVAALAVAKRPVAGVHPRHLRDCAKATGQVAKTDALEAGVLAPVAEAVHPAPRPLPAEMPQQLDAWLQRRHQRLEMGGAARPRMARAHPTLRDGLARPIDYRQRRSTRPMRRALPLSAPRRSGGSPMTYAHPRQAWARGGQRPGTRPCRSGASSTRAQSPRRWGSLPSMTLAGNAPGDGLAAAVRAGLEMATLTATRSHPVNSAFSPRVLARGKAPNVAMTAAMRPCRTLLNATVHTRPPGTARFPMVLGWPPPAETAGQSASGSCRSGLQSRALGGMAHRASRRGLGEGIRPTVSRDKNHRGSCGPIEVEIIMPTRKPHGRVLTHSPKAANRCIACRRVGIAHVNSRVKSCRMVHYVFHLRKADVRDLVLELCCELFNFRIRLMPWQTMV
jgi:transposase